MKKCTTARRKAFDGLAQWLVGWEEFYARDPIEYESLFERIELIKKRIERPPTRNEQYRRMNAEEKYAFRLEVCRKYIAETGFKHPKSFAIQNGVSRSALERWLFKYRAGGEEALRFDYSGVGSKKKG